MSVKERVLAILSDGRPHSGKELATITHRFGAVVHILREEGYEIETIAVARYDYMYQMLVPVTA